MSTQIQPAFKELLVLKRVFGPDSNVCEVLQFVNQHRLAGSVLIHFGEGARFCGAEWTETFKGFDLEK